MQRIRIFSLTTALVFAGVSAIASAGARNVITVIISDSNRAASGTLADARASSDNQQFIGCFTEKGYGMCAAYDASGQGRVCTTNDPEKLDIMRSVSSDTYIFFTWAKDGSCDWLSISNNSIFKPAATAGY